MSIDTAMQAALEFLDDVLSPEAYGHAVPSDARTRAFVVRELLRREINRRENLLVCVDSWQKKG